MTPRRRARPLTREQVVTAALSIVDGEGLGALTMRRLGTELGVDPMAIYRHVSNKEALLDAIVARMHSEMQLAEPPPDHPGELLEAIFAEYRRVISAHPNMLPLATRRPDPAAPSGVQYLVDHGLDLEDAVGLYQSLTAFTIGFALLGAPHAEADWHRFPEELADRLRHWGDETFRRTLRVVIGGYGLIPREDQQ